MRNQRSSTIAVLVGLVVVAVLAGVALLIGQNPDVWKGNRCEQIQSALNVVNGKVNTELVFTEAYAGFVADKGELEKQLADANCGTTAPDDTIPTTTCDTHFFANDPNKVSSRSFGPKVKNDGTNTDKNLNKVLKEFFRRNGLDTALLAENLNVTGIRQDSKAGQQKLAIKLVKDCDARTKYVAELRDLLDKSKLSIQQPAAQTVSSAYMVDGPKGVPVVEWAAGGVHRGQDYTVLQIILPSGKKIWLRLECGFQYDVPGAHKRPSVPPVHECVEGDRDDEGNCKTEPSPSPSPSTPTATPTSTPTDKPCPPWADGTVPPRNPDGSCPKGPDGPDEPAAHETVGAPTDKPETTAPVETQPAQATETPHAPIPDVQAPGASSAPASQAPPATVDPSPSNAATGDVEPCK